MKLPLLYRELDRFGRDKRLYFVRILPALFAIGLPAYAWIEFRLTQSTYIDHLDVIVPALIALQWIIVAVGVPRLLAGSISTERRNGTLDLLVLADFSGWDLLFGKLFGAMLPVISIVAAVVPVQMFGIVLGAVNPEYLMGHWFLMFGYFIASVGISLWSSARSVSPREAFMKSFAIMFLFIFVTVAADYLVPIYYADLPYSLSILFSFVEMHSRWGRGWVAGVHATTLLVVVGLFFVTRALARVTQLADNRTDPYIPPSERPGVFGEAPPGKLLLSLLASYPLPNDPFRRLGALAILLVVLQIAPIAGWIAAMTIAAWGMITFVREAKEDGVLVDVALVPGVQRIVPVLSRAMQNWFAMLLPSALVSAAALWIFVDTFYTDMTLTHVSLWMPLPIVFYVLASTILVPIVQAHVLRYIAAAAVCLRDSLGKQVAIAAALAGAVYVIGVLPAIISFNIVSMLAAKTTEIISIRHASIATAIVLCLHGPWNVFLLACVAAWARRVATDQALLGLRIQSSTDGTDDSFSGGDKPSSISTYLADKRKSAEAVDSASCETASSHTS